MTKDLNPTAEQVKAANNFINANIYAKTALSGIILGSGPYENLANLLAQREQSSYDRGVRDGLEKAAKLADTKASRQEEILKNPPHKLTEAMRCKVYSKRDLWHDNADEIRALMGDE